MTRSISVTYCWMRSARRVSPTSAGGALEAEPDGEQRLNDAVVKISGDAFPILDHAQPRRLRRGLGRTRARGLPAPRNSPGSECRLR